MRMKLRNRLLSAAIALLFVFNSFPSAYAAPGDTLKTIKIVPAKSYIYYGQPKPSTTTEIADYTSQIVSGDNVNITAEFGIQPGDSVRNDYSIWVNNPITCDNPNYEAILDGDATFEVWEYTPTETVTTGTHDYVGVSKATLTAPEGFLISQGNQKDSPWAYSIEIPLTETQNGEATYFLRNNDPSSDCYKAISNAKKYNYTSIQSLPTIKSIKVEKANSDSVLNLKTFGVFGNGSVSVTVEAVGTAVNQETTIYLGEDGGIYTPKTVASGTKEDYDGKYHYIAVFDYPVPVGENFAKSQNLKAYVANSSGESAKFSALTGVSDVDGSTQTIDSKPFILDNVTPNVQINPINGSFSGKVKADVTISDLSSGIAKIEYGWDLDKNLCDDNKNSDSEHYCGFRRNGYSSNYRDYSSDYVDYNFSKTSIVSNLSISLYLEYYDSVYAIKDKHTLYIRVTDNAGNVYTVSRTDSVGSDMHAPNIKSVDIRHADDDAAYSILKLLDIGNFANNPVEIVVTADDNEATDPSATGINNLKLNDREMTKNSSDEYVLLVPVNDTLKTMEITITDNNNCSKTVSVKKISGEDGIIQSNDLVVENSAPTIDFEYNSSGHIDSSGKLWYGASDTSNTLTITAADDQGAVQSGLYSVKITDNEKTIFEKTNYTSVEYNFARTYIIGDFADGEHKISVDIEDNSGNVSHSSTTFYKDCAPPESGTISAVSPAGVTIDSNKWFNNGDTITFRVDSSDSASGLNKINLKVNDKYFDFTHNQILSDSKGYYVTFGTEDLDPDGEHKYTVTGTVYDNANNYLSLEPLTVYKDYENPTISKFSVEKKDGTLGKILNVLTFGAYSNDTLIFKVYANDADYDSGVNNVTVLYDGLTAPQNMTNEGNGVFSIEIPVGDKVFQSEIKVTAYDKYGKSSVSYPNLENAENGYLSNNNFAMIETVKPLVTLNMPTGNGVTLINNQTWYNSNKPIELKVQDENSGIKNIDFKVNGVDILSDKEGAVLLKTAATEATPERNTAEQNYSFDTDYFTSISGEAPDGKYVINIEVIDNAGNISTYETTYYIDKVAPTVDKIVFTPTTTDGIHETSDFIEKLEYGFYFKTDFTITVNVSDKTPSSGLNEVKYRFVPYQNSTKQSEITGSQKITDGMAKLDVPKGFKGEIFVEAFDNVLNFSGEKNTKAYIVDSIVPDISITKNVSTSYHDSSSNSLYVADNSITVVMTDTVSGIKEFGYSQSSEKNSFNRKNILLENKIYKVGDNLGDGWTVSEIDANLVTKITRTFLFSSDDNDIILTFDATDNALNKKESVQSEKFSIDKTSPIINVSFRADDDNDVYYNQNRVADITVIDRNFDANLIKAAIENKFGAIPSISFSEKSKTEHTAVINFDEGDYTFNVSGTDLGNHAATVNYSGGNEKLFYVDKTKPAIENNFSEFSNNSTKDSFNSDKTVTVKVTEHNFNPDLVRLQITRKNAGAAHDSNGLTNATPEILKGINWSSSGDVHTMTFKLSNDAVYQVAITPSDLAGNISGHQNTAVFEIDKTVPVVKAKNGESVSKDDVEFLDVYPYSRKDAPAPTVDFGDLNIDHINYVLTVYVPDNTSTEATTVIKPIRVYLNEDKDKSGRIAGSKFTLPDFVKDGVYSLELVAVDVAGNESVMNTNTYARMINQDVLAYVMESNLANKTGIYSFEYENGDAISKRPDNFSDIKIFVLTKKDTGVDIVLRDSNGDEINTNAQSTTNNSIYGMGIYNFTLGANFFKENFQDDTDLLLHLTVKNEENRIDLGKLHIDNIAPTCDIPQEFKSWQWYYGESERTITVSNISEFIDENKCKVYDNGNEINFKYTSKDNTLVFKLEKGWHNVGVVLDDMAGNANNIQEKTNIHIGFFWLWVIIALVILLITIITVALIRNKRKKIRLEID